MGEFLVESFQGDRFVLVDDSNEPGLRDAVRSPRLRSLLGAAGLTDSMLAAYVEQLATMGAVDKDLLIVGGAAMHEELSVLSRLVPYNYADEDMAMSEEERIFSALQGDTVKAVVDRNGYEIAIGPFLVAPPDTYSGSLARVFRLDEPWIGVVRAVRRDPQLRGAMRRKTDPLAYYVDQYAVTYDSAGNPISVADKKHITVGVNKHGTFVPYVTLLEPFGPEDI